MASIVIILILIIFLVLAQISLNGYKTGFYLEGTYQSTDTSFADSMYLVFLHQQDTEKNVFYHYKQLRFKDEGNYINIRPNFYMLTSENSSLNGSYMLISKKYAYIISAKTVLEYEKISNDAIFLNVDN